MTDYANAVTHGISMRKAKQVRASNGQIPLPGRSPSEQAKEKEETLRQTESEAAAKAFAASGITSSPFTALAKTAASKKVAKKLVSHSTKGTRPTLLGRTA